MQHGDTTEKRLARRERTIIRLWFVLPCLLILLGAPVLILLLMYWLDPGGPRTTTNVRRYQEIRGKWQDGLADVFPAAIPADATNVRLSYSSGHRDGGAYFQVRMTLPAARVAEIADELTATASHKFSSEFRPGDVPAVFDQTGAQPPGPFPDYFTIYALKRVPSIAASRSDGWTGAAVSRSTNEIVYWCER